MPTVIVVENLSKSYLISHRFGQAPAYRTLRETIAQRFARFGRRLHDGRRQVWESEELFWALREVSFTVEEGERIAIIGRNGAGKTTLLKLLSRISDPSSGTIRIRGRLSSLLEVGTGFHPELTGRENIFVNGAVLGMSRAEIRQKFDEIIAFAETERFLDTPLKRYSSGMYVRLAFAVSAFLEPDIIVLDEVLAVGDAAFQKKCLAKINELAAEGRTVLFVSHSMAAVKSLCNWGIVLNEGRASEKMPVEDAISAYLENTGRTDNLRFPIVTDQVECLTVELAQAGTHTDDFDGSRPIEVLIKLRIHKPLSDFRVGFYLKTNFGEIITRALAADWDPYSADISPGEHTIRARIPANFLGAGNYQFEFHCSRFGIRDYFGDRITIPIKVRQSLAYNRHHPGEQPVGFVLLDPHWEWS